jgi:hypothetical protein
MLREGQKVRLWARCAGCGARVLLKVGTIRFNPPIYYYPSAYRH